MKVYDFKGNVIFDDPLLQDKTITENGTYSADSGFDGLGSVTVEVASDILERLENKNNVVFFDVRGIALAVYSIDEGYSIPTPPDYNCKKWVLEDGTGVPFPLLPTEDMDLYANNDSPLNSLYEFYGVDSVDYPYVVIMLTDPMDGSGKPRLTLMFGNGIEVTQTFTRFANIQWKYARVDSSVINSIDPNDIDGIIAFVTATIPSVSYLDGTITQSSVLYAIFTNFEHNQVGSVATGRLD